MTKSRDDTGNRVALFYDIDDTVLETKSGATNAVLLSVMADHNITDIYITTDMFGQTLAIEAADPTRTNRMELSNLITDSYEGNVRGIAVPGDFFYEKGIGSVFRDFFEPYYGDVRKGNQDAQAHLERRAKLASYYIVGNDPTKSYLINLPSEPPLPEEFEKVTDLKNMKDLLRKQLESNNLNIQENPELDNLLKKYFNFDLYHKQEFVSNDEKKKFLNEFVELLEYQNNLSWQTGLYKKQTSLVAAERGYKDDKGLTYENAFRNLPKEIGSVIVCDDKVSCLHSAHAAAKRIFEETGRVIHVTTIHVVREDFSNQNIAAMGDDQKAIDENRQVVAAQYIAPVLEHLLTYPVNPAQFPTEERITSDLKTLATAHQIQSAQRAQVTPNKARANPPKFVAHRQMTASELPLKPDENIKDLNDKMTDRLDSLNKSKSAFDLLLQVNRMQQAYRELHRSTHTKDMQNLIKTLSSIKASSGTDEEKYKAMIKEIEKAYAKEELNFTKSKFGFGKKMPRDFFKKLNESGKDYQYPRMLALMLQAAYQQHPELMVNSDTISQQSIYAIQTMHMPKQAAYEATIPQLVGKEIEKYENFKKLLNEMKLPKLSENETYQLFRNIDSTLIKKLWPELNYLHLTDNQWKIFTHGSQEDVKKLMQDIAPQLATAYKQEELMLSMKEMRGSDINKADPASLQAKYKKENANLQVKYLQKDSPEFIGNRMLVIKDQIEKLQTSASHSTFSAHTHIRNTQEDENHIIKIIDALHKADLAEKKDNSTDQATNTNAAQQHFDAMVEAEINRQKSGPNAVANNKQIKDDAVNKVLNNLKGKFIEGQISISIDKLGKLAEAAKVKPASEFNQSPTENASVRQSLR